MNNHQRTEMGFKIKVSSQDSKTYIVIHFPLSLRNSKFKIKTKIKQIKLIKNISFTRTITKKKKKVIHVQMTDDN